MAGVAQGLDTPGGFLEADRFARQTMRERVLGLAVSILLLGGALLIGANSIAALIYVGFGLLLCVLAWALLTTDFSGEGRKR